MAIDDLPDGTVNSDAVEVGFDPTSLADLIDDPLEDLEDEDEANDADDSDDEPEDDEDEDLDLSAEDDEDEESEDAEEDKEGDDKDGSDAYAGGRFAAHDAKVRLENGETITVSELARNNLYQRDYTAKTTEHAKTVKTFEAQREQVDQLSTQLEQQRQFFEQFAEQNFLPDPGLFQGDASMDPVGYNTHRQKVDEFNAQQQQVQYVQELGAYNAQQAQAKQQEAHQGYLKTQFAELKAKDPTFGDQAKTKAFFDMAGTAANEHYGLTPEEISSVADHRMVLVLKDALTYRRLKAKAPKVKEDLKAQKVNPKPGRRRSKNSKGATAAKGRLDRLRKTGTIEDGASSLMDFDL